MSMQRRRQWTASEKARGVNGTPKPGVSVSEVARRHGVAPESAFSMGPTTAQGAFSGVDAGKGVVPASEYRMLQQQNRELSGCSAKRPWRTKDCTKRLSGARKKFVSRAPFLPQTCDERRVRSHVPCASRDRP